MKQIWNEYVVIVCHIRKVKKMTKIQHEPTCTCNILVNSEGVSLILSCFFLQYFKHKYMLLLLQYKNIIRCMYCSTPLAVVLSSSSSSESMSQESFTYTIKQFSCLIHFSTNVSTTAFNAYNTDSLMRTSYYMIAICGTQN